jgi:hypothetical protein
MMDWWRNKHHNSSTRVVEVDYAHNQTGQEAPLSKPSEIKNSTELEPLGPTHAGHYDTLRKKSNELFGVSAKQPLAR